VTNDLREYIVQHAHDLLDDFVDLVQVVSPEGVFLYVNRAWCRDLGYSQDDALGMTFLDIIHPEHQGGWKSIFRTVWEGQRLDNFEMVLLAKDGRSVPVDGSVWAMTDRNGKPLAVCAALRDSAARAIGEQRLSKQLYRDALTGLYNRRGFSVRAMPLLEVVEENRDRLTAWMLYLDIDNLDQTRRRHGEEASKQAVLRTTELLKRALRAHDLVARIGDNSFAALITLPPRYQPSYVTARVRGALQLANRQAGTPWGVELAMGLAEVTPDMAPEAGIVAAKAQADQSAGRKPSGMAGD
jgi:PAS domain S-box-containing protein/diguanylate cyclase (GGDEF)-like protein